MASAERGQERPATARGRSQNLAQSHAAPVNSLRADSRRSLAPSPRAPAGHGRRASGLVGALCIAYAEVNRRLVKGTEFEGIGFHTLRHSFSSNLARAGVDDRMIDYFMGHQTEEMRRRYQHLFPRDKRDAIERLDY